MSRAGAVVGVVVGGPSFAGMRTDSVGMRGVIVPARGAVVILERHALPAGDRKRPLKGNRQSHQENQQHAG